MARDQAPSEPRADPLRKSEIRRDDRRRHRRFGRRPPASVRRQCPRVDGEVGLRSQEKDTAMASTIPDKYLDLFQKKAFANLATLMPDGSPQVTPV